MRSRCDQSGGTTVATTGTLKLEPGAINVIPSKAVFTVDVRNPSEKQLRRKERALADYLSELKETDHVSVTTEQLIRFQPVFFNECIVGLVEEAAGKRRLASRRITSGAGQDAQMMARICPTAMIFVPSAKGDQP